MRLMRYRRLSKFVTVTALCVLVCSSVAIAKDKSGGKYGAIDIGPTGILGYFDGRPEFTVLHVYPDSAADGKLEKNDVITSVNGTTLTPFFALESGTPKAWNSRAGARYILGKAVTDAEATDGILKFGREGKPDVTVKIPVLGAYSESWPVNCKKSDQIVKSTSAYLRSIQGADGRFNFSNGPVELPSGVGGFGANSIGLNLAALFLLSTGEEEDLEAAKKYAATISGVGSLTDKSWYLGYQGLFLGEYYLRTGDKAAKQALEAICQKLAASGMVGGWAHDINAQLPGYVRGGLMNQAGVICFMSYLLGRECGVEFDEEAFIRTLNFFYKFAGKGIVPYGDHRPGPGGPGNGRAGSTACAYSIMDDARAMRGANLNAYLHMRTYAAFEAGHTGPGFNLAWRGIAAPHIPAQFEKSRNRSMQDLAWYYDLGRSCNGSLRSMPVPDGETRYASLCWGTGALGLHYTAFRKTLRITGKPRGEHNTSPELPPDELWRWWEEEDTDFLKVGFCEGGSDLGLTSQETFPFIGDPNTTVEQLEVLLRHYNPSVRISSAQRLARMGTGEPQVILPVALDALERGLQHPDARVQRAACEGISGYHNWFAIGVGSKCWTLCTPEIVSERFAPYAIKILKDPKADIWLKDGALWVMARAKGETVVENSDLFKEYDNSRIWWLRHASRWRVKALADSGIASGDTFDLILAARNTEGRAFATVDLNKLLQMSVGCDAQTSPERMKQVIGNITEMYEKRHGAPQATLQDAYGYKVQKRDTGIGSINLYYHLLNHLSAEAHLQTYPTLLKYLNEVSRADSEVLWDSWVFTSSRFNTGLLPRIVGAGEAARPALARFKQFLVTDEQAVARAKVAARISFSGARYERPRIDESLKMVEEAIAAFEAQYGEIKVAAYERSGRSYLPYVLPKHLADEFAGKSKKTPQPRDKNLDRLPIETVTGTWALEHKKRTERKDKVVEYDLYSVTADGKRFEISDTNLLDLLPVMYNQLMGSRVELKCRLSDQPHRATKSTETQVVEILALKVL